MIAIADAGATKTDWALLGKEVQYTQTPGIQPYFTSQTHINLYLSENQLLNQNSQAIQSVFFYGAGCSGPKNQNFITNALSNFLGHQNIHVFPDIMGAARALFHNQSGIACILGTGTNCCRYNGIEIKETSVSLGYILGDEGSGAYFGKELLRAYFYRKLPEDLSETFKKQININKDSVLDQIYNKKQPNFYLASFTRYLKENNNHPFIKEMIKKGFEAFTREHLLPLADKEYNDIRFTGSVAWHFQEELEQTLEKHGMPFNLVIQSPIKALVRFHQKQKN
jgi:N-acetylglucosamine kinase-like BadF-type ATPase